MKITKITFKKAPYQSFQLRYTDIKYQKKKIGYIKETENGYWKILFAVKKQPTEKEPSDFEWIKLKKDSLTEKEARKYILNNQETIFNMYNIHQLED